MLFLLSMLFVVAGIVTLWPRYFADASLTFTLSGLAALVLIGIFAGIALTLMLDSNASAGGQP